MRSEYAGDALQRLIDIEALRQLKARQYRFADTQQWDEWGNLFVEDVAFSFPSTPGGSQTGRDALVAYVRSSVRGGRSVHHAHTAEIEITGRTTAYAIWAMADFIEYRQENGTRKVLSGTGHYHDQYVKQEGVWRIVSTRLERLRVDTAIARSEHLL